MNDFRTIIHSKKPNVSDGTLKTYCSSLRSIARGLNQSEPTLEFYKDVQTILPYVQTIKNIQSKKSYLTALFVLTDIPQYREAMIQSLEAIREIDIRQEPTQKQRDAWMSMDEIHTFFHKLMSDYSDFWTADSVLESRLQIFQNIVILACMSGIFIPPRRLLDWTEMRIRNYNPLVDNYYDNGRLVFNRYKTAKRYGRQEFNIPPELHSILQRWIHLNPTGDYLFHNVNGDKLDASNLNIRLKNLFKRPISCNMFRHIYITERVLVHQPRLQELQEIATFMAHDILTQMLYRKVDISSSSEEDTTDE